MTRQQVNSVLGLCEKKPYVSPQLAFARQVREATARGQETIAMEQRAIDDDVANRQRLGLQPPLHVRTAEAMAKIRRGEMASDDHTTWGASDPLKQKAKKS
jgi:hypothetical protein